MAAPRQLQLLSPERVLQDCFGRAFFSTIPKTPGVYFLRDAAGALLYVGKAKNLRQRLNSYRHPANPSRKTARLLQAVRGIEWELCASDASACLRENELIRTHRPRFNRVGTWPEANRYIVLERGDTGATLRISDRSDEDGEARPALPWLWDEPACGVSPAGTVERAVFGAFRPGIAHGLRSLMRVTAVARLGITALYDIPRELIAGRPRREWRLPAGDHVPPWIALMDFFAGRGEDVLGWVAERLPPLGEPALAELVEADLVALRDLFVRGPRRNRLYCEGLGRGGGLVRKEELGDVAVLNPIRVPARTRSMQ